MKNGKVLSLFDQNKKIIDNYESVIHELAPDFAKLVDFKLKLTLSSTGEFIVPPPAFIFLPFYMDQDLSWNKSLNPFKKLGQFRYWQDLLLEYHTGIKPNVYYELLEERDNIKRSLDEDKNDLSVQNRVFNRFNMTFKTGSFNIDIEAFRDEINELLIICNKLKKIENELKDHLVKQNNSKITFLNQINLVEKSLKEIKSDYKFLNNDIEDHIGCPTCGALYENSFSERFSIAEDENRCNELLIELKADLIEIERKIKKTNSDYTKNNLELNKINNLLAKKRGEVQLKEILESEGKKEVKNILQKDLEGLKKRVYENEYKWNSLTKKLQEFNKSENKKNILNDYRKLIERNTNYLDVHGFESNQYNRIYNPDLKASGSQLPRSLLAYQFAILQIINKYSSAVFCPIVIDSPNQQDQGKDNLKRMVDFIFEFQPNDSQLILVCAENDYIPNKKNCNYIHINKKEKMLEPNKYEEINEEIKQYINQSYFGRHSLF